MGRPVKTTFGSVDDDSRKVEGDIWDKRVSEDDIVVKKTKRRVFFNYSVLFSMLPSYFILKLN